MFQINHIFSNYILGIMLIIGIYLFFWQSKYLKQVDHLLKEASFTKIVGGIYIIVSLVIFIIKRG